jgi:hypothetical protein
MKTIFTLLVACLLCGCQTRYDSYMTAFEKTRKIDSADVAKLPSKLKYGQLIKLWGPATIADPLYMYQSKIDGVVLMIFLDPEDVGPFASKLPDQKIIGMSFTNMGDFYSHAWGRDIIRERKQNENH